MTFEIKATDTRFPTSPDSGHPECLCSRCGDLVQDRITAIRAWPEDGSYEYRFHPACLGFLSIPPDEDEEY
jgi:hypothetical protein